MELKAENDMVVLGARFNINRSKKQLVVVKRGSKRPNLREITVLEEEKRNKTVVN
ncbi:hypothetical protein YC2023_013791 [Brassica napus]